MTSCIDGYHVCIFAYGQTGSGKTHTMEVLSERSDIVATEHMAQVLGPCRLQANYHWMSRAVLRTQASTSGP